MNAIEGFQLAGSIISSLAAAGAVILGLVGLNTWKHKRKFDAACKMLGLSRQFADELQESRNPFGNASEYAGRSKGESETPEESAALNERYARMNRLAPSAATLRALKEASWEVEALTQTDLASHIREFTHIHNRITIAIETRYLRTQGLEQTQDEFIEMMTLIYGPPKPDDPITEELEEALQGLRVEVKKHTK